MLPYLRITFLNSSSKPLSTAATKPPKTTAKTKTAPVRRHVSRLLGHVTCRTSRQAFIKYLGNNQLRIILSHLPIGASGRKIGFMTLATVKKTLLISPVAASDRCFGSFSDCLEASTCSRTVGAAFLIRGFLRPEESFAISALESCYIKTYS